jgi:hypothetical protein
VIIGNRKGTSLFLRKCPCQMSLPIPSEMDMHMYVLGGKMASTGHYRHNLHMTCSNGVQRFLPGGKHTRNNLRSPATVGKSSSLKSASPTTEADKTYHHRNDSIYMLQLDWNFHQGIGSHQGLDHRGPLWQKLVQITAPCAKTTTHTRIPLHYQQLSSLFTHNFS